MNFIETLITWDTHLFLLLNSLHNAYFDKFMFLFSEKLVWIPFYLALIFEIIKFKNRDSAWLILALIICVVLADQISSTLIKDTVQRLRPSQDESMINLTHIVNNYKGGKYGFVSSHAANTFGLALLTSLIFKNKIYTYIVFSWASISAYSRVYLGVHYPGDVLGGVIVGIFSALFCYGIIKKYWPQLIKTFNKLTNKKITCSSLIMIISITGLAIYSFF